MFIHNILDLISEKLLSVFLFFHPATNCRSHESEKFQNRNSTTTWFFSFGHFFLFMLFILLRLLLLIIHVILVIAVSTNALGTVILVLVVLLVCFSPFFDKTTLILFLWFFYDFLRHLSSEFLFGLTMKLTIVVFAKRNTLFTHHLLRKPRDNKVLIFIMIIYFYFLYFMIYSLLYIFLTIKLTNRDNKILILYYDYFILWLFILFFILYDLFFNIYCSYY